MSRRAASPPALTQQQIAALAHIASGKSIAETARLTDVIRGSTQR